MRRQIEEDYMLTIDITRTGYVYGYLKAFTLTIKSDRPGGGYLTLSGLTSRALRRELATTLRHCIIAGVPYEVKGEYVEAAKGGTLK
jgi:hypothetical protein